MKLFKGNTIKQVNNLLDKGEKRRAKLEEKVTTLQNDVKVLREAIQDDFNLSILEERDVNKKLEKELSKVLEELTTAEFHLSQIDSVIESEMAKRKEEIDQERKDFVKDKGEEFRQLFDELNDLKLAYLNKLIEYKEKKAAYNSEYSRTFRDIENRVGLTRNDPRGDFAINFNQRHQIDGRYNAMIYGDELRAAFVEGKLPFVTNKNKDIFKK